MLKKAIKYLLLDHSFKFLLPLFIIIIIFWKFWLISAWAFLLKRFLFIKSVPQE